MEIILRILSSTARKVLLAIDLDSRLRWNDERGSKIPTKLESYLYFVIAGLDPAIQMISDNLLKTEYTFLKDNPSAC
jgi:hypothetical protein